MKDRDRHEDALADYIRGLIQSLATTSRAEDRTRYVSHLAAAARIFAALRSSDATAVEQLLADEERAFGWSYLSDKEGQAATTAFTRLCKILRSR